MQFIYEKTRKIRYRNYREKSIIIRLAVLTQYQSVRDRLTESVPLSVGQSDRQDCYNNIVLCIASYDDKNCFRL